MSGKNVKCVFCDKKADNELFIAFNAPQKRSPICIDCHEDIFESSFFQEHVIFCKLISRIEKLEQRQSELEQWTRKDEDRLYKSIQALDKFTVAQLVGHRERLEKLEQDNKDLNESYQGLSAELRHVMQKLEKKES